MSCASLSVGNSMSGMQPSRHTRTHCSRSLCCSQMAPTAYQAIRSNATAPGAPSRPTQWRETSRTACHKCATTRSDLFGQVWELAPKQHKGPAVRFLQSLRHNASRYKLCAFAPRRTTIGSSLSVLVSALEVRCRVGGSTDHQTLLRFPIKYSNLCRSNKSL
jgi:hypothetical protein